jgi:hypothetical protein
MQTTYYEVENKIKPKLKDNAVLSFTIKLAVNLV